MRPSCLSPEGGGIKPRVSAVNPGKGDRRHYKTPEGGDGIKIIISPSPPSGVLRLVFQFPEFAALTPGFMPPPYGLKSIPL